jgi:RNA polymerase sigma-70 factor (ECF subfamily)
VTARRPDGERTEDLTGLLKRWGRGDRQALEALVPLVEAELRKIARRYLRREGRHHTVDGTTSLVNETYTCLLRQRQIQREHRLHFFGIAARIMRQVLVDHARRRQARKRGGGKANVILDVDLAPPGAKRGLEVVELIALHGRQARVVELRFFGGLTIEETAESLQVSLDTVKRDWRNARLWLRRELVGTGPPPATPSI